MSRATIFGCALFAPVAAQDIAQCTITLTEQVTQCATFSGQAATAMSSSWTALDTTYLDNYCMDPCYSTYYQALKDYVTCYNNAINIPVTVPWETYAMGMDYMCTKNFQGEYCLAQLPKMQELYQLSSDANSYQNPQNMVCEWIKNLGCCYTSLMGIASVSAQLSGSTYQSVITDFCGFDLPPECPGFDRPVPYAKTTFTLSGLVKSYNDADADGKLKILLALSKDIAQSLEIDASRVSVAVEGFGADLKVVATLISDGQDPAQLKSISLSKLSSWTTWTNTEQAAPDALALESSNVSSETGSAEYFSGQPSPEPNVNSAIGRLENLVALAAAAFAAAIF